jgi:hypothetical protein
MTFNTGDMVCLYCDKEKEVFIVADVTEQNNQTLITTISSINKRKLDGAEWLFISPPKDVPQKAIKKAKEIKI